eukprot:CAMPEP_0197718852 /NCGR_PEP_ID=MMETSP1434-20131217/2839_1 /TAXON_ID=265543 /ORGANISM="Minutocellus polymorphus, Strain CCMP3303" /LENGTH=318 /DNA_ID=CAMNT_0043303543 /DNA_START=199 /DNA_END=1155 /DNA_ORIENTATION=+
MPSPGSRTTRNAQEGDDKSVSTATSNDAPTNCVPCASVAPQLGRKKSSRRTRRGSAAGADYLLHRGEEAPNFQLQSVDGSTVQLSDFRGKKVMVCFYRHPFCPICAYTVNNLIGHYKKLAWACKLEILTIFMASLDEVRIGIKNNLLPIEMRKKEMLRSTVSAGTMEKGSPDNRNSNQYPFHALADPDGAVSSLFRVGRRNLFGCIKDALPFKHAVPIIRTAVVKGDNAKSATMLPSEFLIDEQGIIVDLYRAKMLSETIPMERVNCFLIGDKCVSRRDLTKQKSKGSNNTDGAGRSSTRMLSKISSKRSTSMYNTRM